MKQTNLQAIQNLNVYLDTIQTMVDAVAQSHALADPEQQSQPPSSKPVRTILN